ncbi:MAG: hypothetical protein HYT10_00705, partial [Candidatus Levybacteria bacterium]|nr:hypothetical protein [Candidatus Levybacteria bacterium]
KDNPKAEKVESAEKPKAKRARKPKTVSVEALGDTKEKAVKTSAEKIEDTKKTIVKKVKKSRGAGSGSARKLEETALAE